MGLVATPSNANGVPPGVISPIFSHEIQYWGSAIRGWAGAAGLDPNLVATVMQIEFMWGSTCPFACRSNRIVPSDARTLYRR